MSQPNIIVALSEQQRWDTVGAYESPMELTPTLDALARRGTIINQAISPQPVCTGFRAAFHTGMYPTEVGGWRNGKTLNDGVSTLADLFGAAGYDVGFIGNWQIGGSFDEPVPKDERGGYNDFWVASDVPEFTTYPHKGHLFDEDGCQVTYEGYRADAFTNFAIEGVDSLTEPFFLVVSYLEPHQQNNEWTFIAPDGYSERYSRDPYVPGDLRNQPGDWYGELPDYYGMIKRLDECISDLLSALEERNVWQNTIFSYTSDHGCHFRTRPGEYKRTCHESAVRVPAILSGGVFDEGVDINSVTSTLDLPPTLLDAAGIEIPASMHGKTLVPLVTGDEGVEGGSAFIQITESQVGRALRTERWKYAVAAPAEVGWRRGEAELASETYVERYLYDLYRDPSEQTNLIGRPKYRDTTERLRNKLLEHIHSIENKKPLIKSPELGYGG